MKTFLQVASFLIESDIILIENKEWTITKVMNMGNLREIQASLRENNDYITYEYNVSFKVKPNDKLKQVI